MLNKSKILIISLLLILSHLLYSAQLNFSVKNSYGTPVIISYFANNNPSEKFKIKLNNKKCKTIDLSLNKKESIKLEFHCSDSLIAKFNISYNDKLNHLKNYIPFSGPVTGSGCSWDHDNCIKVSSINSIVENSWIPFVNNYTFDVSIELQNPEKINLDNEYPLAFTLFAIPSQETVVMTPNSNYSEIKKTSDKIFDLSAHNVTLKTSLSPVTFEDKDSMSRWVDLVLHNYTENSYILYAIRKKVGSEHIRLLYKNSKQSNDILFYPPLTQLRGPGFKFSAEKENNIYTAHPSLNETKKGDKYYIVIGNSDEKLPAALNCIAIELSAYSYIEHPIKDGININSSNDQIYQNSISPFNCRFGLKKTDFSSISNMIRIPVNDNGKKVFTLSPMKNVDIELVPQNNNSALQANKVAVTYRISGESAYGRHEYKVIIISPPFLNGNSPGIYSPLKNIPSKYDVGNYVRHPLHIYVLPLNKNSNNELIRMQSNTQLPKNLIGEVKYFISDNITTNSN